MDRIIILRLSRNKKKKEKKMIARRLLLAALLIVACAHDAFAACACTAASASAVASSSFTTVKHADGVYADTSSGDGTFDSGANCSLSNPHGAQSVGTDDLDFFAMFDVSDVLSATSTGTSVVFSLNASLHVLNTTAGGANETLIVHFDLVDAYGTINCAASFSALTFGERVSLTLSNLTGDDDIATVSDIQVLESPDMSAAVNALIEADASVCPSILAVRISISNTTEGAVKLATTTTKAALTVTATCPEETTTTTTAVDHGIGAGYVVIAGVAVAVVAALSAVSGFF